MKPFGGHGEGAADQFGTDDRAEEGDGHDQFDLAFLRRVGVFDGAEETHADEIDGREGDGHENAHAEFSPKDAEPVAELDFTDGHTADDQRAGLRAAVAARVHQHGDEGGENRRLVDQILAAADDGAGERRGNHQDEKPDDSVAGEAEDAGLQIFVFGRLQGGHLFEVFGVLRFDDVDDIVDGDDADDALFVVDDRHGVQVVVLEFPCDFLLVVIRMGMDDVGGHDGFDRILLRGEDEFAKRDDADKLSARAGDETIVDGLLVNAALTDVGEGFTDGHGLQQGDVFDGHDAAGGVLLVFERLVDEGAFFRGGVAENHVDHVGRQFLQEVDGIVEREALEDFVSFRVGDAFDNVAVEVFVEIGEYVGGLVFVQ